MIFAQAPTLAFLKPSFWSAKRLAILIGFALTALGTLGPQFYVSAVEDRSGETDQFIKSLTARIDTLRAAQSQYLLASRWAYSSTLSTLPALRRARSRRPRRSRRISRWSP